MGDLESQGEDAPKCILWYKPMSWLGHSKMEACLHSRMEVSISADK
jgi:hypothetical protein